jgi:hypothetical protein
VEAEPGHGDPRLLRRFLERAGLPDGASVARVIGSVQAIPYGRPADRTAAGVTAQWRGTCSTKHALLAALLAEGWPTLRPRLVHRVYLAERADVLRRHGATVAAAVPAAGLMDVHRYLLIELNGHDLAIDVTFPESDPWDGQTSMPVACGPGRDIPAGTDPDADKRALEAQFCDPGAREPFIAALAQAR